MALYRTGKKAAGGGGNTGVLVWTNSAPSSPFAPQTVSIDLSNYDYIGITFDDESILALVAVNNDAVVIGEGDSRINRSVTANTTGVTFGSGGISGGTNVNNGWIIPKHIYGFNLNISI